MLKTVRNILAPAPAKPEWHPEDLQFNEAVNLDLEAIFIAVPKTGTTSIRTQIRPPGTPLIPSPHLNIMQVRDGLYTFFLARALRRNTTFPTRDGAVASDAELRQRARDTFERFFKFSTVRNPWARTVSLYARREGVQMRDTMSFTEFCHGLRYASDTCLHPTRHANQIDWLTDETGALAVDYVMKLEEFETGLAEIARRTGGRVQLEARHGRRNPESRSRDYREIHTDETREIVGELFARDIAQFDYTF